MPRFQVAKTTKSMLHDALKNKITDRLIIHKDSETKATLYYDYDAQTRLEIGAKDTDSYYCTTPFIGNEHNDFVTSINNIKHLVNNSSVTIDQIILNSLITDGESIGIITGVQDSQVTIRLIYKPTTIEWNNFY